MKNKGVNNAKVGLFVLAGVLFLIFTLYMIGKNRNLFGSTFTIKVIVNNVNGLTTGNNVRFKGIDVGTVKSITVSNDTSIEVSLLIDGDMKPYIKKNAIATISTDGLMGNKLLNLNSQEGNFAAVDEGDVLYSLKPVETDQMLRTLDRTNNNIEKITRNLYEITVKLNSSNSLWTLLSDTVITQDLKTAVVEFKRAGSNTVAMTQKARDLVSTLEHGDGLAIRLFTDTTFAQQLSGSLQQINDATHETKYMMGNLKAVVDNLKEGQGSAGLLLTDTLMRNALYKSALHIESGTDRFNQNMEALKANFFFRRYFKKMAKEKEKEKEKANLSKIDNSQ